MRISASRGAPLLWSLALVQFLLPSALGFALHRSDAPSLSALLPDGIAIPGPGIATTPTLSRRKIYPSPWPYAQYMPPPGLDDWYKPPSGWESAAPGAVLKTREKPYPTLTIKNTTYTYQVLYRSSDTHGNASWAVSTLYLPSAHDRAFCNGSSLAPSSNVNITAPSSSAPQDKPFCAHGIVTYAVPYDSADINASPSFLLQFGEPYGEMRDSLIRGWAVNVPDYEGPDASYCAGGQAGHAVLDSVRAVLKPEVTSTLGFGGPDRLPVKTAVWGYSGGAMAADFAAEMVGSYAPDVIMFDKAGKQVKESGLAGIIVGGPAPNLTTVDRLMNGKDTAGLVVASIVGITSQHKDGRDFILSSLHPDGDFNKTFFMSALTMTGIEALDAFSNQTIESYFAQGAADMWGPELSSVFDRDGVMGMRGVPDPGVPVFFYKAIEDEMTPLFETDDLVHGYCAKGSNILYQKNTIGGHNQELWNGRPRAVKYLEQVLDGNVDEVVRRPLTGCKETVLTDGDPDPDMTKNW